MLLNTTMVAESVDIYINYGLISLVSFSLGSIVGWGFSQNLDSLEQSEVRRLMAVVMLGSYVLSLVADIAMSGYSTPFLLHTIMGGIFGYLFSKGEGINFTIRGE